MKETIKATINLGKINYRGTGKRYPAFVTIELRECGGEPTFTVKNGVREYTGETTPTYTEFSACGYIGACCGGQCLDTMNKFLSHNADFAKIYKWWQEYHLNGMNAGTPEQEKAIKEYFNGRRYDYTEACEYLKTIGLYEVNYTGKTVGRVYDNEPYKYGHAWIVDDIPENVLNEMREYIKSKQ